MQDKVGAPKVHITVWTPIEENSLVFIVNNALIYKFPLISDQFGS